MGSEGATRGELLERAGGEADGRSGPADRPRDRSQSTLGQNPSKRVLHRMIARGAIKDQVVEVVVVVLSGPRSATFSRAMHQPVDCVNFVLRRQSEPVFGGGGRPCD